MRRRARLFSLPRGGLFVWLRHHERGPRQGARDKYLCVSELRQLGGEAAISASCPDTSIRSRNPLALRTARPPSPGPQSAFAGSYPDRPGLLAN
ncbi:hypothetical protein SKAU_G00335010 [Synaphobranchus kaupii]|uniref:Uncharacterized protein n=1 Tax=Synaphobranchus kaupii TaxID=118154 RepID=A0A9Q1ELU1_SYNKA|nr:hypothetical protein SKAU_G00335010 [Synaphobranchus kaupii]